MVSLCICPLSRLSAAGWRSPGSALTLSLCLQTRQTPKFSRANALTPLAVLIYHKFYLLGTYNYALRASILVRYSTRIHCP